MIKPSINILEKEASDRGLLLRIQVRRPFNIWSFKLVVGQMMSKDKIQLSNNRYWITHREIGLYPFPKANHKLFALINKKGWNV